MNGKILFVDDDPNILAAYKRNLKNRFVLETALSGQEGLELIEKSEPFEVIVADMNMPGMDGIQFLSKVKEKSPDTVRIMLTGNAEQRTAMDAVNEGSIFRFLNKPCSREILSFALEAGIKQYQLITAEHELLENTLRGSIRVLTELMSMINPVIFSQSMRIRKYVKHIAGELGLPDIWQFEMAAMLSQIGCVTIPPDIIVKKYAGDELDANEQRMFSFHPEVGSRLLGNISRLELIAGMIEGQQKPFDNNFPDPEDSRNYMVAMGSQVLKTSVDFDNLLLSGLSHKEALIQLKKTKNDHNPQILTALENLNIEDEETEVIIRKVRVKDLMTGMIADQDVKAANDVLLVPKDQEFTYPVLLLVRNFAGGIGVREPFRVRIVSPKT